MVTPDNDGLEMAASGAPSEVLVVGAGSAGSRVAYYLMQRGGIPHARIIAVDTEHSEESDRQMPGLERLVVPPAPAIPVGAAAEQSCASLNASLELLLPNARMMVVLAFSGGSTGIFYAQCALAAARRLGRPATAIVAMPHASDGKECLQRSRDALEVLHSQGFACLPLDCAAWGSLFPDNTPGAAYLQAVRWVAETTIGYLKLFTDARTFGCGRMAGSARYSDAAGKTLAFDELPRGIFSALPPTIVAGRNLDVPTFMRQQRQQQ